MVKVFHPNAAAAQVCFVPADWNGAEMDKHDIAVDIHAGGKGVKGEQSGDEVGSAAKVVAETYMPKRERSWFQYLIRYAHLKDTNGSVAQSLQPKMGYRDRRLFDDTSLHAVLVGFKALFPGDDYKVCQRMWEIFDGYLLSKQERYVDAPRAAAEAQLFHNGSIALIEGAPRSTASHLFKAGAKIVIFKNQDNLGALRKTGLSVRLDATPIRKVIEKAGEEIGEGPKRWHVQPDGRLISWGTYKAPRTVASRVSLSNLVDAIAEALEDTPR